MLVAVIGVYSIVYEKLEGSLLHQRAEGLENESGKTESWGISVTEIHFLEMNGLSSV